MTNDKKGELKEFKLYDFMNDTRFAEMQTAVEYVDFFMTVKQDTLLELDAINLQLCNTKFHIRMNESTELLNTDFKALYGKDNEDIRKSHLFERYGELYGLLEDLKYKKSALMNQLDILNDMIKSNPLLLADTCECDCHGN